MEDTTDSDSEIEEFSGMKQPPLIKQLRGILAEYPDDGQIIKELVQNAEDASATDMKILFDGRCINNSVDKKFPYRKFFKGPALCFYNNALFEESDWEGITMIYSSVKEEDPLKVGRFGLGFKSVFHITDYVCILSGRKVLLMNPHEKEAGKVNVTIKLSNLKKVKKLSVEDINRALSGTFGYSEEVLTSGHFNGTIFWFPLREVSSDLSDSIYNKDKVIDLFKAFQTEAFHTLLFLKNLDRIQLFCMDSDSAYDLGKDRPFFVVELDDELKNVRRERQRFMQKVRLQRNALSEIVQSTTRVYLQTNHFQKGFNNNRQETSEWVVVNYFKGNGMSKTCAALANDKSLSYSPYVGVATRLDIPVSDFKGHLFCFLPLPQETKSLTGLPVHVNGFFALSQNRRHLKWPSADQDSLHLHKDKSLMWNECLVNEVVPDVYNILLNELISMSVVSKTCQREADPNDVYDRIPDRKEVDDRWMSMVDNLTTLLFSGKSVFTKALDGIWLNHKDVMFASFSRYAEITAAVRKSVLYALEVYKQNVAEVPPHVWNEIQRFSPKDVTPADLCKVLKSGPQYRGMSFEQKQAILEFCLYDAEYQLVDGLELIPLKNGQFAAFGIKSKNVPTLFIATEKEDCLCPGLEHKFVALSYLPTSLQESFRSMAMQCCFQIRNIDIDTLVKLLEEAIHMHLGAGNPVKMKADNGELDVKWLKLIWEYIQTRYSDQEQKFKSLNLIPVSESDWNDPGSEISLFKLDGNFVLRKMTGLSTLPKSLCQAIELLTVVVLPSLPKWLKVEALSEYIHYPSIAGLLKVLDNVFDQDRRQQSVSAHFNKYASTENRNALIQYFGRCKDELSQCSKMLFCRLKLFKQTKWPGGKPSWTALVDNNSVVVDISDFPVAYPRPLIELSSENERDFASALEAKFVNKTQLVQDTLRLFAGSKYSSKEKKTFMKYFLRNTDHFQKDAAVMKLAVSVAFLDTDKGTDTKKAQDLYDPTDKYLHRLFVEEGKFPIEKEFLEDPFLYGLRKLGLKLKKAVTAKELLMTAKTLDSWCRNGRKDEVFRTKAEALFHILEDKKGILFELSEKSLGEQIAGLKCLSFEKEAPSNFPDSLSWFRNHSCLASPDELKHVSLGNVIGAVSPVIKCEKSSPIAKYFGWTARPKVNLVLLQLDEIIKTYNSDIRPSVLPLIVDIYRLLKDYPVEELKSEPKFLSLFRTGGVWWGDGFCSPERIYVDRSTKDIDAEPYMYHLPGELWKMSKFFKRLGCHKNQSTTTLFKIEALIKEKHSRVEEVEEEDSARDFHLIIAILNRLKNDPLLTGKEKELLIPIQTKGSNLMLVPATDCTFCNDPWLRDTGGEDEEEILFVHADVPLGIIEAFKIESLTRNLMSEAEGFEEWGQEEPLTRRINHLLRDSYVDGFSVPKEIVQNADDAGATEVFFLYDERENKDARKLLFDEQMSECQGPALWAYNNARFRKEDLKNITKLGGATKESDSTKIGKFGLGFCSVYNLTDVPSLVSGNDIVVFDPHTTYLGKALPGRSPGLKIDLTKERNKRIMKKLSDQFKPFDGIFGFRLSLDEDCYPEFQGTLFRFPFRTANQSETSKISSMAYSKKECTILLEKLMEAAANLLLFTQNIKCVKLFHLPPDGNPRKLDLLYSVSKNVCRCHDTKPTTDTVLAYASKLKDAHHLEDVPLKITEEIVVTVNVRQNATAICPAAKQTTSSSRWLVSWATGTSDSITMSYLTTQKGAVPLGAVAVLIKELDEKYLPCDLQSAPYGFYKESHLFCFLPLPVITPLKVHINGCFAVRSDRKDLKTSTEDDKYSHDSHWNEALIGDPIANALLHLLESFRDLGTSSEYVYHKLWPVQVGKALESLQKNFYIKLLRTDTKLFLSDSTWIGISNCKFLDPTLRWQKKIGDIAFHAFSLFTLKGSECAVDIPRKVLDHLLSSDVSKLETKLIRQSDFFGSSFLPQIDSAYWSSADGTLQRNQLVLYALELKDEMVNAVLKNTRCIPTKPKGVLKKPNSLVNPDSKIAVLFSNQDERFPEDSKDGFCSKRILERLVALDMMTGTMDHKLVLNRALSIQDLAHACTECGLERCSFLLDYLKKLKDPMKTLSRQSFEELCKIPFLPTMPKPPDWPVKWKADGVLVKSPKSSQVCLSPKQHRGNKKCRDNDRKPIKFEQPLKLYSPEYKAFVACSECVLDRAKIDKSLGVNDYKLTAFLKLLGVRSLESKNITVIVRQLEIIAEENHKQFSLEEMVILNDICSRIFKYLNGICTESPECRDQVARLKQTPFLRVGKDFITPNKVAFSLPFDCAPDLYGLQQSDYASFKEFFKALGVKESFSSSEILSVITRKKERLGNNKMGEVELKQTCRLLEALVNAMAKSEITFKNLQLLGAEEIFVPDTESVLRPNDCLCMDDSPDIKTSASMTFVHPDIPPSIALALGIKSKKRQHLKDHTRKIRFGQREKLVTRLKRILSGYPCDAAIMKELLQNADDAGATEIHFIKDFQRHGHKDIFDKEYKAMQGPALCVYNNRSFTEKDLEGIQNLGLGSKGDDPFKTGQYGVGFNAVYHLTDIPSLLSKGPSLNENEVLCYFDPMCKYVPDATKEDPGICYIHLEELRGSNKDIFNGYHEDVFESGIGTMFRFPLRNSEMASMSEISSMAITEDFVKELLELFKKEMFISLLFLKHLKKIFVSNVENGQLVPEFSVQLALSNEDASKRSELVEWTKTLSGQFLDDRKCLLSDCKKRVGYFVTVKDSNGREDKFYVVQQTGFQDSSSIPGEIKDAYVYENLAMMPQGGVALPIPRKSQGMEKRLLENSGTDGRAFCFLPLPVHTGLPFHINGHFALDSETRRNLYVDENESRGYRSKWNICLLNQVIKHTYITAIQKMKQYIFPKTSKIKTNWSKINESLEMYYMLIPIFDKASDVLWKNLVSDVYNTVLDKEEDIFPIPKKYSDAATYSEAVETHFSIEWTPMRKKESPFPAFFNDLRKQLEKMMSGSGLSLKQKGFLEIVLKPMLRHKYQATASDAAKLEWQLTESLTAVGLKLITVPSNVKLWKAMEAAGIEVKKLQPSIVMDFLKSFREDAPDVCVLKDDNIPVTLSILQDLSSAYCLLYYCSKSPEFLQKLDGLPLLITNDLNLRRFSSSTQTLLSTYCDLFPGSKDRFICKDLVGLFDLEETIKVATVFSTLDITTVIKLLPDTLQIEQFKKNKCIEWVLGRSCTPNKDWIKEIWNLLALLLKKTNQAGFIDLTEEKKQIKNSLGKMSEWCLVPAKQTCSVGLMQEEKLLLVPISLTHTVLDAVSFVLAKKLRTALEKLKVPKLDTTALDVGGDGLLRSLVSSEGKPHELLSCLHFHQASMLLPEFLPQDSFAILEYFDKKIEGLSSTSTSELKSMLKALPLFMTVQGSRICLADHNKVFVPPKGLPQVGIGEWAEQTETVLLEENVQIAGLYGFLGCAIQETTDVYVQHILPTFQYIPEGHQLRHLEYIRDKLLLKGIGKLSFDVKQRQLIDLLKRVSFVKANGRDCTAGEFYSPHEDVFRAMCKARQFPPSPFSQEEWKEFMELAGMKKEITVQLFVQFAKEIEEEGEINISVELIGKSKVLINHLFESESVLMEGIFQQIARIHFIAPFEVESHLSSICQQKNCAKKLICYSGSTLQDHAHLVWTTCNVLPSWAEPKGQTSTKRTVEKQLGILADPKTDQVLLHIKQFCTALHTQLSKCASEVKTRTEIEEKFFWLSSIMIQFYKYLKQKNWKDCNIKDTLYNVPVVFLPEEMTLAPAYMVVYGLSEEEEIKPFLFRFPIAYGEYLDVFVQLGGARSVSPNHFAMVLKKLYEQNKDEAMQELHPDELRKVRRAIETLFFYLRKASSEEQKLQETELFLPDENKILLNSRTLYVVDNEHHRDKIGKRGNMHFFLGFSRLEIHVSDQKRTIGLLPESVRPRLLSEVVQERLDTTVLQEVQSYELRQLEQFLASPHLMQGLLRLLQHEGMANIESIRKEVSENLNAIKVHHVIQLRTRLFLDNEPLEEAVITKECFLERKDDICHLYFQKQESSSREKWFDGLLTDVVMLLSDCVGRKLKNQALLIKVVSCIENPQQISKELDKVSVRAYSLANLGTVFPPPGKLVPEKFHVLLDNTFGVFEIGEYVAFEISDFEIDEENSEGPGEGAVYIYAKIVKRIDDEVKTDFVEVFQMYEIDIGEGKRKTVGAFLLYKFQRKGTPAPTSSSLELVPVSGTKTEGDAGTESRNESRTGPRTAYAGTGCVNPDAENLSEDEICKKVRQQLKEAQKKPEDERKKILKRLLFMWHPDKNHGKEGLCTRIFQYIQNLIVKLDNGENIDDEDKTSADEMKHNRTYTSSPFDSFFENIFRRGRRHRDRYRDARFDRGFDFNFGFEDEEPVPLPREARRWYRQAKADLDVARRNLDFEDGLCCFNWICLMCYHVAEKVLRAAWFMKDGDKRFRETDTLLRLVIGLEAELQILTRRMTTCIGSSPRDLTHPRRFADTNPSSTYNREKAEAAIGIAQEFLDYTEQQYFPNG